LLKYSKDWNLEVNIEKTKVMIFRNGGNIRNTEKWLYENNY